MLKNRPSNTRPLTTNGLSWILALSYCMHISTDESKAMENTTGPARVEIRLNSVYLKGRYRAFYIWARPSLRTDSKSSNLSTKFRLYNSLVVPVMPYCCQTWTWLTESERRIEARVEMLQETLRISYTE